MTRRFGYRGLRDDIARHLNDKGDLQWEDWRNAPPGSFREAWACLEARVTVFLLAVIGARREGPTP